MSRGRKGKKNKKVTSSRSDTEQRTRGVLASRLGGERRPPDWFDSSIKTVLDRASVLVAAQGPRELEQATCEILGSELHRVLHTYQSDLWFGWWFKELVDAAAARAREEREQPNGAWPAPLRLLHGMTSIGGHELQAAALTAVSRVKKDLRREFKARPQPPWLGQLSKIRATGQVWKMRDAYGTRFALIAGYSYPGGSDPSVFLFDIDACGFVRLAHAGVFDDLHEAATAWRTLVGDPANGVQPNPVDTADGLYPLVYCHYDDMIMGDEPLNVMENWFRASRRKRDLIDALGKRGILWPPAPSLFEDIDPESMATEFVDWYTQRHGTKPEWDVVYAIAEEWMEGKLPETWYGASPHRAEFQLTLINDWVPDDPVTMGAKALLPEWVRWLGEQADLPQPLIDRAVAVAAGGPRTPSDCAGVGVSD